MNTIQLMCLLVAAAVFLASAPVANARSVYGDWDDYDDYGYGGNYGYPGYGGNYGYPGYGGNSGYPGNYGGYDNNYGGWLGGLLGGGGRGKWGNYGYGKK